MIDSFKPRERLGCFLSHTFLGAKAKLGDSSNPRPILTPIEELKALKSKILAALDESDFELFTQYFEELRVLAKRGHGHLPSFNFFYYLCREIHGQEKFVGFLASYVPNDPSEIFHNHPDVAAQLLKMTIKPYQFHAGIHRSLAPCRPAPVPQENFETPDAEPTKTTFAGL